MLFYVKKHIGLDLAVTALLGGLGYLGIRHLEVPVSVSVRPTTVLLGVLSFILLTGWTFLVQASYSVVRGREYAQALTESLGKEYADASWLLAVFGGLTAAFGEELLFRGFIQGKWGIVAGAVAFGLAHFGKKDIRVVSYWSFMHGFLLGLSYWYSGDLAVPMIAHGLFDLGGITYFRFLMRERPAVI